MWGLSCPPPPPCSKNAFLLSYSYIILSFFPNLTQHNLTYHIYLINVEEAFLGTLEDELHSTLLVRLCLVVLLGLVILGRNCSHYQRIRTNGGGELKLFLFNFNRVF